MRVISGSARGTKLKTLSGEDTIRPTTDRVKESVFNIIQFEVPDAVVLDVFCGSGALGIESLSRGAFSCDFVDSNSSSLKIAEDNINHTHLAPKAKLFKRDFEGFFSDCTKRYDLIFADPPYAAGFLIPLLEAVGRSGALSDNGVLIFETSSDTDVSETEEIYASRTVIYGNTKVIFYRRRENI